MLSVCFVDHMQVEVVISLLPASCHFIVANACIEVLYAFFTLWVSIA